MEDDSTARIVEIDKTRIIDDFKCSICLDLLYKPATLICGHTFCMGCISQENQSTCPNCKIVYLAPTDYSRDFEALLQKVFAVEYAERGAIGSTDISKTDEANIYASVYRNIAERAKRNYTSGPPPGFDRLVDALDSLRNKPELILNAFKWYNGAIRLAILCVAFSVIFKLEFFAVGVLLFMLFAGIAIDMAVPYVLGWIQYGEGVFRMTVQSTGSNGGGGLHAHIMPLNMTPNASFAPNNGGGGFDNLLQSINNTLARMASQNSPRVRENANTGNRNHPMNPQPQSGTYARNPPAHSFNSSPFTVANNPPRDGAYFDSNGNLSIGPLTTEQARQLFAELGGLIPSGLANTFRNPQSNVSGARSDPQSARDIPTLGEQIRNDPVINQIMRDSIFRDNSDDDANNNSNHDDDVRVLSHNNPHDDLPDLVDSSDEE